MLNNINLEPRRRVGWLTPPRRPFYRPLQALPDGLPWVGYGDQVRDPGLLEGDVAALPRHLDPPILPEPADDLCAFIHKLASMRIYIHTHTIKCQQESPFKYTPPLTRPTGKGPRREWRCGLRSPRHCVRPGIALSAPPSKAAAMESAGGGPPGPLFEPLNLKPAESTTFGRLTE